MANTQSVEIAALEASPPTLNDQKTIGSHTVTSVGTVEDTPVTGDTLQMVRVPVQATLDSIFVGNDDMGTTAPADIGFHQIGSPGTVVDANAIATAIVMGSAIAMVETRYEVLDIDTTGEKMWELAGLSARPTYPNFDIVLTWGTVTAGTAGTISWRVIYTI